MELTRWFSAHLYDAVRLARHLAAVERPYTHGHFHGGHTSFSMVRRFTVQTLAIMQGSGWSVLAISKITVAHTSTRQTNSNRLCSRKFVYRRVIFFRFITMATVRLHSDIRRACAVCVTMHDFSYTSEGFSENESERLDLGLSITCYSLFISLPTLLPNLLF